MRWFKYLVTLQKRDSIHINLSKSYFTLLDGDITSQLIVHHKYRLYSEFSLIFTECHIFYFLEYFK